MKEGDNGGNLLWLYDAVKEDGTPLQFVSSIISRDGQYVTETTQFQDFDGKAKICFRYFSNPIGKNFELNIPLQ